MTGTVIQFAAHARAVQQSKTEAQCLAPETFELPAYVKRQKEKPRKNKPIKDRWFAWVAARKKVEFYEALRKATNSAEHVGRYDDGCEYASGFASMFKDKVVAERLRIARDDLILTPVTNRGDLLEKRRIMNRCRFVDSKLKPARVTAALAADEAYLALPRGKRADALRGKAVR